MTEYQSRPGLKKYLGAATRVLNRGVRPMGLMGERLNKAIATFVGCAMHDPTLHLAGLSFDGPLGREDWIAAWSDASDIARRTRYLPDDTWLTRWAPGPTHQAPFLPRSKHGPIVLYVHEGTLQVAVGYSSDGEKPAVAARMVLGPGARFEAANPGTWTALCPLEEVTMTVIGLQPEYDLNVVQARVVTQNALKALAANLASSVQ